MRPRTWNDVLALILVLLIPMMWTIDAAISWEFAYEQAVIGASILAWGNVVQYYFRKSPPTNNGGAP